MIFEAAEQLWTHERVVTVHKQRSCYFSVVWSPATRTIWIMSLTSNASLMPSFYPFLSRLSGWTRLQIPPAGSQALSQHQRKHVGPSHAEPFTASPKHLSTPLFVPHTKLLFPFIAPGLHFPASAHQEFPKVCWTVCSVQRGRKYQLGCEENCLQPKTQRRSLQSSFRTIPDFLLFSFEEKDHEVFGPN